MASIYEEIKKDHDTHRALMERLGETTGDSEERRAAWTRFFHEIKSHSAAEEETFYSKLISKTWGQDAARHSVHEHAQIDDLLDELNEMDMSSGGWLTKFKTLRDEYEHHMEEEENEVFARAKKVIGAEQDEEFGERFRKRKVEERGLVEEKQKDKLED